MHINVFSIRENLEDKNWTVFPKTVTTQHDALMSCVDPAPMLFSIGAYFSDFLKRFRHTYSPVEVFVLPC